MNPPAGLLPLMVANASPRQIYSQDELKQHFISSRLDAAMPSTTKKNKFLVGAIIFVVLAAAGWLIFAVFFPRTAEPPDIAWVLEVTGKGWNLKGNSRALQVGDRLPAGGVVVPNSDDDATTITICDFEGNATRFVGRDRAQTLPQQSEAGLAAKLWRRIADSFEPKDIHAISRGDDDHLNSSVAVLNEQGKVDLSPILSGQAASILTLRCKPIKLGHSIDSDAVKKTEIDWDPTKPNAAISPPLSAGLYSVEVQGPDTGLAPKECLLLVCSSEEFPLAKKEFDHCLAQINSWPVEIRDALGERNRRACVRALAVGESSKP